jgi:hypothetical protein
MKTMNERTKKWLEEKVVRGNKGKQLVCERVNSGRVDFWESELIDVRIGDWCNNILNWKDDKYKEGIDYFLNRAVEDMENGTHRPRSTSYIADAMSIIEMQVNLEMVKIFRRLKLELAEVSKEAL